jgi:hypothetical protein
VKDTPNLAESPPFLSGWKEIANYLGKGVRTVQRYEREFGFPVRRPAAKSRAAVIATKAEVDAWVSASPIREQFRLSNSPNDFQQVSLDSLKRQVERMSSLRDEMRALRADLKASVRGLAESIQVIHGEIEDHWRKGQSHHSLLEPGVFERSTPDQYAGELLPRRTTRRKAS